VTGVGGVICRSQLPDMQHDLSDEIARRHVLDRLIELLELKCSIDHRVDLVRGHECLHPLQVKRVFTARVVLVFRLRWTTRVLTMLLSARAQDSAVTLWAEGSCDAAGSSVVDGETIN